MKNATDAMKNQCYLWNTLKINIIPNLISVDVNVLLNNKNLVLVTSFNPSHHRQRLKPDRYM